MFLDDFRELDRVAVACFEFLVRDRGAQGPTIAPGRGRSLEYALTETVFFNVGLDLDDRSTPFLTLTYQPTKLRSLTFFLDQILEAVEAPASERSIEEISADLGLESFLAALEEDSPAGLFFEQLVPFALALHQAFDQVLHFVQENTAIAKVWELSEADLEHREARRQPDRETFWQIVDSDYVVSWSGFTCPTCGTSGNVGEKRHTTAKGRLLGKLGFVVTGLFVASLLGWWLLAAWRAIPWSLPLTLGSAALAFVIRRAAAKESTIVRFCPKCRYSGEDFVPREDSVPRKDFVPREDSAAS